MPSARQPSVAPSRTCRPQVRLEELRRVDDRADELTAAAPAAPAVSSVRWCAGSSGIRASAVCVEAPLPDRALPRSRSAGTSASVRVLAQLQRADVGGDRPAVARVDLRRVVRHRAEAVGDDVEEVADRRVAQPVVVIATAAGGSRAARPSRRPCPCGRGRASSRSRSARWPRASTARVDREGKHRRVGVADLARCRAARPRAAGRAPPCPPRAAAPTGRRRRTSTRAAACTSAGRACPAGRPDRNATTITTIDAEHAEHTECFCTECPVCSASYVVISVRNGRDLPRLQRLEKLRASPRGRTSGPSPRCRGRTGCGWPARSAAR